jgi:glycosyltransferase involved in cell wall biosynthesis
MIETIISKEDINALHLIGIRVFGNIRTFEGDIWLEYIDSMALNFKSRIGKTKSAFMRYFLDLELKRLLIYEKKLSLKARHSFIVSKKDKLFIGAENINVIQLGLDLSKYVRSRNEALDKYIVFSGNMSYHPNIVSTLWFIENCWPILKKHQTNIKLVIAGRNPADSILNLAKFDGQIRVTGEVEDMGVILSKATVAIAPMQSGSGMQLKILEAMGCSVPVVTTSLGLGDIDAVSNKEVKVADTPSEFTQAVVDLCDDNTLNYEIGAAGNQYLKRAHSNEVISSQFIDIVSPKAV